MSSPGCGLAPGESWEPVLLSAVTLPLWNLAQRWEPRTAWGCRSPDPSVCVARAESRQGPWKEILLAPALASFPHL